MTAGTAPLVSVLTATFNRAATIGDAVRSVLEQTVPEVEHLVVDDGSTDATPEVLAALTATDPRVRVARQPNGGPSAARNRALALATGRYIAFLDSDDVLPLDRFERQLHYLAEHPDADAAFGTEALVLTPGVEPPAWTRWAVDGPRYCWSTMLVERADVVAVGGFDETLWHGEDTDLTFRLRGHGVRIDAVDDVYLLRRFFGDNLTYAQGHAQRNLLPSVRRHLARRAGSTG